MLFYKIILFVVLTFGAALVRSDVTPDDLNSWTVKIHPRTQKVAEGSVAIFTCDSSLPGDVRFEWTKPKKPIKSKDAVEIVQISPHRSVLKVASAHTKKHRRTYRCNAFYEDPSTGVVADRNANAVLKVVGKAKSKDILAVTARVDTWMTRPPGTEALVCEIGGLRRRYTEDFTWIKDSVIDLSLEKDSWKTNLVCDATPGTEALVCEIEGLRRRYTEDFTWIKDSVIDLSLEKDKWKTSENMRMLFIRPGTGGTYQCVAYFKKGSVASYSNLLDMDPPISENIVDAKARCMDYNGTTVPHGEMFYPTPCEHCQCENGDSGACAVIDCIPIPEGCQSKPGGKCCEFVCPNATVSRIGACTDYRGNMVMEGDTYRPGDDPCETCLCTAGSPSLCDVAVCDAPPCPNYITIPDTCCGFKCLDCFDHAGLIISDGDSYQPGPDPCETCMCDQGRPTSCFNVACMKPRMPCDEPIPIPGECCKFTCDRLPGMFNQTISVVNRTLIFNDTIAKGPKDCVSYNGTIVREGSRYPPESDPCKLCTCSNGQPSYCLNMGCYPPKMPCADPQPIPGQCCQFMCNITLNNLVSNRTDCVSYDGSIIQQGSRYQPDWDPCKLCTCTKGQPNNCLNMGCNPPRMPCSHPLPVPGQCCEFTCFKPPGLFDHLVSQMNHTTVINDAVVKGPTDCVSYNGTIVREGGLYQPDKDPCKLCTCVHDRPSSCMNSGCIPPRMPCPEPIPVLGQCCKFTCDKPSILHVNRTLVFNDTIVKGPRDCVSYNGTIVREGSRYPPESDPCKLCTCSNGQPSYCLNVGCYPPKMPCADPQPIPGQCCQFMCNITLSNLVTNKTAGCMSYNGSWVNEGEFYAPDFDPCKICTCTSNGPDYCMMVACRPPPMPCDNPRPVPGVCCQFTCDDSPIGLLNNTTGCKSYNGTMVQYGMRYQPNADPCEICVCTPSERLTCMYTRCAPPPGDCPNPQKVPHDCCGFTCNMTGAHDHAHRADYYPIAIQPIVQQIGPRLAMVQWEVPDREKLEHMENVTFHVTSRNYYGHAEAEPGMDYVVLTGLNHSQKYDVTGSVYGKLRHQSDMRTLTVVEPVKFSLDVRATTSLNLRNAVGKVYESRGSYESGPYNLPRPFEEIIVDSEFMVTFNLNTFNMVEISSYVDTPCPKQETIVDSEFMVTFNLNTFNMVEISSYVDTPCPKQECGLLRFYMYSMTGHPHNVMSLMFEEDVDFTWAKAHL